jgi:hypothetical protein
MTSKGKPCKNPDMMPKENLIRSIQRTIELQMFHKNRMIRLYKILSREKYGRNKGKWKYDEYWGYNLTTNSYIYKDTEGVKLNTFENKKKGTDLERLSKAKLIKILIKGPKWQDYCY